MFANVNKYVDINGSVAMLAMRKLAGVTLEVNHTNPLHTGKEAWKWGIQSGFETQDRRHQKSKTVASVAPQKGLVSSKFILEKKTRGI